MKICFLSLNSYPILKQENHGYVGGAEVEQTHLGVELASEGYDVSFVTYNYGQNQMETLKGIKVIKTYSREKVDQIPFLYKYGRLWYSLKKADADIYFHEAGSYGVLPIFCSIKRKKFIHRIASDAIVLSQSLNGQHSFFENLVDTIEIKTANAVIAQTEFQKRILTERFGVKSIVIKNGLMISNVGCEKAEPPVVLWVGSLSEVKNPGIFIELAKSIPDARFEMVGGRSDPPKLYAEIEEMASKLPNLRFYGFVSYEKINEHFRKASVLVNTSSIEGFPNTFIQAWDHYVPVVSLNVDPDQIIKNKKLGFCSGTREQLRSDLTSLLENEKLRKTMGENGKRYVESEHNIRTILNKYIEIFEKVL